MPITSNVAWDTRLESFKGRDTAQYIETVMGMASRCAACRLPLGPGAAVSLTVDITESHDLEGMVSLTFDPAVYHLQCQEPALRLIQSADFDSDLTSVGARLVLARGPGSERSIPVLAFTLTPSLVFGAPGGEMTSALVSALLNHGFQMSLTGSYGEIVRRSVPARDTCTCSVSDGRAGALHVDGELLHSQQHDQTDVGDALWLEGTTAGHILVISGDNLVFTETGLEVGVAARLGTLVTGIVPVIA
ncbi:hypothetical protein [Arthrobacter globiformis]|uniref:Uncharacterized protein n=1 Tax=Arthrobacter globiformis TaxID=1665 RepID=A0A328HCF0_ARTGO|nr:hypothetical protein [Arthrobacter globiformis]RAM35821.1 hypothetical protein DBZ45_16730 [Arthrobacter globiformis]